MAEDEIIKIEKHKESLQSTVKKRVTDQLKICVTPKQDSLQRRFEQMKLSYAKTPILKQKKAEFPPILFGKMNQLARQNKRIAKQLEKEEQEYGNREKIPINRYIDFDDIPQEPENFKMQLLSQASKEGPLIDVDIDVQDFDHDKDPPPQNMQRNLSSQTSMPEERSVEYMLASSLPALCLKPEYQQ